MESLIRSSKITVERKQFFVDYKENGRGRFLRITEDVNGRRDSIIIPSTGLRDLIDVLHDIMDEEEEREQPGNYVGNDKNNNYDYEPNGNVR